MFKNKPTLVELIKTNKEEILRDKEEIEKIEKRLEDRWSSRK